MVLAPANAGRVPGAGTRAALQVPSIRCAPRCVACAHSSPLPMRPSPRSSSWGLACGCCTTTYGLPYVYNVDEGSHFTNRAVGMFGGDVDPGYFQNPSAFTYLEHLAAAVPVRARRICPVRELRPADQAVRATTRPTIYRTGARVAAVLCMLGVIAVFWVGAAAVGHVRGAGRGGRPVVRVPAGGVLAHRGDRRGHAAAGVVRPLRRDPRVRGRGAKSLAARRARWPGSRSASSTRPAWCCCRSLLRRAARATGATAARSATACSRSRAALAVFFVTNPYLFIDLSSAWHQLHGEAELAGKFKKLGQEQYSGPGYYFQSLTWGLGWAPRGGDARGLG